MTVTAQLFAGYLSCGTKKRVQNKESNK